MQALGFHHLAIQARDVERVAAFYRVVLGLAEVKRWHRDDGSLRSVWVSVGGESGFLNDGEFFVGNEAARILAEGLRVPDEAGEVMGPIVGRCAGDDAFKVFGVTLCFLESFAAAVGAADEVVFGGGLAVEGVDDGFGVDTGEVDGAVAEVD